MKTTRNQQAKSGLLLSAIKMESRYSDDMRVICTARHTHSGAIKKPEQKANREYFFAKNTHTHTRTGYTYAAVN